MNMRSLRPGQILYDVRRESMGNTTARTTVSRIVRVVEVGEQSFLASWNGNPPQRRFSVPSTWKARKPHLVETGMYSKRPATRDEIKSGTKIEQAEYIRVEAARP